MKKILFFSFWVFVAWPLIAQEAQVTSQNAPRQTPFAQPFAVQLTVAHPEGTTIQPDENSFSPDFEIVDAQFSAPTPEQTQITFTAVPFALEVSTFTVTMDLLQNGEKVNQTQAAIPITITPVKLFDDKEIKEIRPPKLPLSLRAWILCLLLAAGLVWLLVWLTQRKKRIQTQKLAAPQDNRPPHVIALSQINALIDSGLWENQKYKLFYITLSDILRQYLWQQFKLDTSADTSVELLRRVKTCPQLTPFLPPLKEFVSSANLVKFAKVIPTVQDRNRDITTLRFVIDQTTPKPPATEEKTK